MNILQAEWDRLYSSTDMPHRVSTRSMVLELARPADWDLLSPLWRGVQTDLELPAPAIAVNGQDGFQLWFSLAEPVPVADARAFLASVCLRYLRDTPGKRITLSPSVDPATQDNTFVATAVPAQHPESGCWSAFVAPDLAAIFSDEPWLDLAPNPDAQANVLARCASIQPTAFRAALHTLHALQSSPIPAAQVHAPASTGDAEHDPRRFLQHVMNDSSVALQLRIEAAKALLPYFSQGHMLADG